MKVALVYDRINKWGGAERVLLALHEIWPKAPLYTAVYSPKTAPWAEKIKVIPSFLNQFPLASSRHEIYPWLMPLAFESFNFDKYEVVISLTSEAAKGIITKPSTLHVCYCLTPTRYLWSGYQDYFQNKAFRFLTKPIIAYLRYWDKIAAQRPDVFIAISKNVQQRIKKYYGRDSEVIYPPVVLAEVAHRATPAYGPYFLVVSRLDFGYKKVDLAIEAFNKLGLPLKVVGTGREMGRLKRIAKRNIQFLGQLTDKQLLDYYQRSTAVIFPQEEDWGIVPLEAQSCGRPVIAFRGGGALETVIENKTGLFFTPQTAEALIAVVKKFKGMNFEEGDCRRNALKFKKEIFIRRFKDFVEKEWKNFQN